MLPATAAAADRPPLSISLGVGAQYDSNVSVDDADLNVNQGDAAALLSASIRYNLVDNRKTSLRVGYSFDETLNQDLTDLDLEIHSVSAGGTHRLGKVQLGLDYQYSHVLLDRKGYLDMHLLSPSAAMFVGKSLFVRAAYMRLHKGFDTVDRLDAKSNIATFDTYRFFRGRKAYVAVGLRMDDENASGAEYSYHAKQGSLRVQLPISLAGTDIKARAGYVYGERRYQNITPSIGVKRREKRSTFSLGMDIGLTGRLTLKPQFRFVDRDSNVPVFDYREHVVSTMLVWKI